MSRIYARIFEHINYSGQYRWLIGDIYNFGDIGFHDKVSSIIVYRGNQYQQGDRIRFYEHSNFTGGYLELEPGLYPNIQAQPFSFGDKISSANFLPFTSQPSVVVRLRARIYEHANYAGQYRDILWSENNLGDVGFHDKVSSIRIFGEEDYTPGWVCDFFEHSNFSGGMLWPGKFGPGISIANIGAPPYSFGDKISSVRIYQM